MDQEAKNLFRIDEVTGEIFPLTSFDRETKDTYIFDVEASDSSPSSLPGTEGPNKDLVKIHISVTDINDNPPHFEKELYEATLNENAELQTEVMVIKAKDIDERKQIIQITEYLFFRIHTTIQPRIHRRREEHTFRGQNRIWSYLRERDSRL